MISNRSEEVNGILKLCICVWCVCVIVFIYNASFPLFHYLQGQLPYRALAAAAIILHSQKSHKMLYDSYLKCNQK